MEIILKKHKFRDVFIEINNYIENNFLNVGAIPRLWEVRHLMEELKTSADTAVMYGRAKLVISGNI